MPIVLKTKTKKSPGIIIFTHNEILRGVPRKSKKIEKILVNSYRQKEWIFGAHIQGDCSNLPSWPYKEWQNFFMWPNKKEKFLENIAPSKITELTCINFLKKEIENFSNLEKEIDIITVTRFSSLKKINMTLEIFKKLSDKNKNYKFLLVAPKEKPKRNFLSNNEINYFIKTEKMIENIKNNPKYKNIKFIISDIEKKGLFPLSEKEIYRNIGKSKYLILNSHREGVPRVLIESLCLNTRVIISNKLKFGLSKYLDKGNSFIYDEKNKNFDQIIDDIHQELKKNKKILDEKKINEEFDEKISKVKLFNFIKKICVSKNIEIEDIVNKSWRLENLKYRLACHFKEQNHQIIKNENLFLMWFKNTNEDDNYNDEKYSYLFKQDNFDIILEVKFFIQRLIKFTLRKLRIK